MYVRTKKDIIYKAINIYHDYRNRPLYEVETGLERLILDADELREAAKTIEELCDEFICVLKNGEHNRVMLSTAKEYAKGKMEIYGAIWTDKGLIYVAKLNDKGELELL